ncbi:hypothetical protein AB0M28_06005 [Streptomyces sp. NPDC051940]|uniref:hypothetical protein n=1 Tax=Streptomyces sp. NPDC051940 TaxID=3155675 RepID=UPI0034165A1F
MQPESGVALEASVNPFGGFDLPTERDSVLISDRSGRPGGAEGQPAPPDDARMARMVDEDEPAVEVDKQEYIDAASEAGNALTADQQAELTAGDIQCWSRDVPRSGYSAAGVKLWTSHHRVNWCGDGEWIREHALLQPLTPLPASPRARRETGTARGGADRRRPAARHVSPAVGAAPFCAPSECPDGMSLPAAGPAGG